MIDLQVNRYEEMAGQFPASAFAMTDKIEKAQKVKAYFRQVLETYFPEGAAY